MTYLHKILCDNGLMKYEYGKVIGEYIGAIEFRTDVPKDADFESRDVKLIFYGDNFFNAQTGSALQAIAYFIRENYFPDDYLRATY